MTGCFPSSGRKTSARKTRPSSILIGTSHSIRKNQPPPRRISARAGGHVNRMSESLHAQLLVLGQPRHGLLQTAAARFVLLRRRNPRDIVAAIRRREPLEVPARLCVPRERPPQVRRDGD